MDPDGSSLLTHSMLAAPAAVQNVLEIRTAPVAAFAVCIGLFVVFLALCAFFTLCETALEEYSESRLEKLADQGDRKAERFLQLAQRYSSLAAKIRTGFVLSAMACQGLLLTGPSTWLAAAFVRRQGLGLSSAQALSLVISVLLGGALVLIAGYLLPRRLAWRDPNRTAVSAAGALGFFVRLLSPFSALCSVISNGILRLMIYNVFEFDDRTAEDVMTHRTEIEAVPVEEDIDEALKIAIEEGFSRIPVYEDTLDNVVGVLYAKDLLMLIGKGSGAPRTIRALMRPALYVPESTRCRDLFRQFQQKKVQIAIVVDEYGGTSGMVTMEDLLESIVGEIQDEYDEEEETITQVSDSVYHIDGSAALEDVQRLLPLEVPPDADYDTLSGLLTDALGRIPAPGEHPELTLSGIRFTVLEMDERRIGRVKAQLLPPDVEEEA